MTVYRARMDAFVLGLTIVSLVVLGLLVVGLVRATAGRVGANLPTVALLAGSVLILGIVVFAYVYAPRAFRLRGSTLTVERPAGDVVIPLQPIEAVRPLDAFLGLSVKAPPGGNSGLFGIYGAFYRKDIGRYRMYGRAASGAVLLTSSEGNIVVAPERRDEFIAAVRSIIATRGRDASKEGDA